MQSLIQRRSWLTSYSPRFAYLTRVLKTLTLYVTIVTLTYWAWPTTASRQTYITRDALMNNYALSQGMSLGRHWCKQRKPCRLMITVMIRFNARDAYHSILLLPQGRAPIRDRALISFFWETTECLKQTFNTVFIKKRTITETETVKNIRRMFS